MAKAKSFAVIGIGQFGRSVVEELIDLGMDVVAIDKDESAIKKVANILPTSYVADSSDEQALRELGIKDVEYAIVAFGSNKEASVLTTVLLKDIGVSHVIVRVDDDSYIPIMKKLGATEVITPQRAAGQALANRLGNDDYKDFYKLDEKYSVVSIVVNPAFVPKQLKDMNSKNLYGVNIVLIRRKNSSFVPGGNDSVLPDDMIYVVGTNKEVKAFRESINGKQR